MITGNAYLSGGDSDGNWCGTRGTVLVLPFLRSSKSNCGKEGEELVHLGWLSES